MAFGQTKQSSITAAGRCAWARSSSITLTLRFIGLDIDQRILAAGRGQLADEHR